jgi:hypothetical protein
VKFIQSQAMPSGETIAAVETDNPGDFGSWQILRIVRVPEGVTYKSSRTKGVRVLYSALYQARNKSAKGYAERWAAEHLPHYITKCS